MRNFDSLFINPSVVAKRALETAQSNTLGFDELKALIESSPAPEKMIAWLLFERKLRPEDWGQRLALFRWVFDQKNLSTYLSLNASLSLFHTALHIGDYETAGLADSRIRQMVGGWSKLPQHSRTGKKDRTHLYFSHLTVSWPLVFLSGSVGEVIEELERGREFLLALGPKTLQRPVYTRTIQNVSRIILADSAFSFVRKDFSRISENLSVLQKAFQEALLVIPKNEQVRREFLSATPAIAWSQELLRLDAPRKGPVAGWTMESQNVAYASLRMATRVTGKARIDVFERFTKLLRGISD